MKKTYLEDATTVSIFDFINNEKVLLGRIIFGICAIDELKRFKPNYRVITSKIMSQNKCELITKSDNCYVINIDHNSLELSIDEFALMRKFLQSPQEIIDLRERVKKRAIDAGTQSIKPKYPSKATISYLIKTFENKED